MVRFSIHCFHWKVKEYRFDEAKNKENRNGGADATGSSSGVAKAQDRPAMVDEMIGACRKAWDEAHA